MKVGDLVKVMGHDKPYIIIKTKLDIHGDTVYNLRDFDSDELMVSRETFFGEVIMEVISESR